MTLMKIFEQFARLTLIALGVSAVSSCAADSVMRADYGTPYADYAVKGSVTDEDNNPVPGIRVVRGCEEEYFFDRDTTFTDAEGKFSFGYDLYYILTPDLKFEDIDGNDNGGLFETKYLTGISYEKSEEGDGDWFYGKFTAILNVSLTKK